MSVTTADGRVVLSIAEELDCLEQGFAARADHNKELFWKDRRRTKLLERVEAFRTASEDVHFLIIRLKKNGQLHE